MSIATIISGTMHWFAGFIRMPFQLMGAILDVILGNITASLVWFVIIAIITVIIIDKMNGGFRKV